VNDAWRVFLRQEEGYEACDDEMGGFADQRLSNKGVPAKSEILWGSNAGGNTYWENVYWAE